MTQFPCLIFFRVSVVCYVISLISQGFVASTRVSSEFSVCLLLFCLCKFFPILPRVKIDPCQFSSIVTLSAISPGVVNRHTMQRQTELEHLFPQQVLFRQMAFTGEKATTFAIHKVTIPMTKLVVIIITELNIVYLTTAVITMVELRMY